MNKKRKHHYIPVGILKNFQEKGHLHIYFKKSDKFKPVSPNNAFAKRDLNRLKNLTGIDEFNGIEDIFDLAYESPAIAVFSKIIEVFSNLPPDAGGFSNQDYLGILNFIKVSIFRTPHVLEHTNNMIDADLYSRSLISWYEQKGNFHFPDFIKRYGGIRFSFLNWDTKIIKEIQDLKLCVNVIEDKEKQFLINDSYINIVTPNHNWFQDEQLELHFAISPKLMLSFYRANPDVQRTVWHSMNSFEIDKYNALVIENSYDMVGCKDLNYLEREINNNKNLLSVRNKYHNKLDWLKFKANVIREIQRYESECRSFGKQTVRLHVTDNFEFRIYSEDDFKKLL